MEESKQKDPASNCAGKCDCKEFPLPDYFPDENQTIRRVIKAFEEELEKYSDKPTDATKKFGDDLKDAEKEYLGIDAIVSSYEKFYDKLDCLLADARRWREEIEAWCDEKVDPKVQTEIKELRAKYDKSEKDRCCAWIKYRDQIIQSKDCLGQATVKVEEAKDDFKAYKDFEKTLNDRFSELKSLFEKAVKFRAEEKHNSVCAVGLEFDDVYKNLGVVLTWKLRRDECGKGRPPCEEDLKKEWPPEELKKALMKYLRALILVEYQRFRWAQCLLELQAESKKNKEACDNVKKTRRDEFIQEAEDLNPPTSSSTSQQQVAY